MDSALQHHSHKVMLNLLKALPVNQSKTVDEHDDAPPPYEVGNYIAPPGSKYIASPEDDEDYEDDDVDEDMFSDAGSCCSDDDDKMYLDEDDQDDEFLDQTENNDIPCNSDTPTGKELPCDPPAYSSRPSSPARSNNIAPTQQQTSGVQPGAPQPASAPPRQQGTDSAANTRRPPPQHTIIIDATTRIRGANNKVTADFAYLGAKLADRILSHLTSISPAPNEPRANFSVATALGMEGPGRRERVRASSAVVKTPTIHLTVNCGLEIEGDGNIVVGGQGVQQAQGRAPGPQQACRANAARPTGGPQRPREDTSAQAARDRVGQLLRAIRVPAVQAEIPTIGGHPDGRQNAQVQAQTQDAEMQTEHVQGVQQQAIGEEGAVRMPKREREDNEEDRDEEDAKKARL